jgi:hypothetical protein
VSRYQQTFSYVELIDVKRASATESRGLLHILNKSTFIHGDIPGDLFHPSFIRMSRDPGVIHWVRVAGNCSTLHIEIGRAKWRPVLLEKSSRLNILTFWSGDVNVESSVFGVEEGNPEHHRTIFNLGATGLSNKSIVCLNR